MGDGSTDCARRPAEAGGWASGARYGGVVEDGRASVGTMTPC